MSKLILPMQNLLIENKNQFFKLPNELVVAIIKIVSLNATSPDESLKILSNLRLIDRKFNILSQEITVIKDLIEYWSKKLNKAKAHLIFEYLSKKSKWFDKFLLRLLNLLDIKDLNEINADAQNILMLAILEDNLEVIDILLSKNLNFKAQDKDGRDVLMFALFKKNVKSVSNILLKDINIKAKDGDGKSVLKYASETNDGQLFELIISKGADPSTIDYEDVINPFIVLKYGKRKERINYLLNYVYIAIAVIVLKVQLSDW